MLSDQDLDMTKIVYFNIQNSVICTSLGSVFLLKTHCTYCQDWLYGIRLSAESCGLPGISGTGLQRSQDKGFCFSGASWYWEWDTGELGVICGLDANESHDGFRSKVN